VAAKGGTVSQLRYRVRLTRCPEAVVAVQALSDALDEFADDGGRMPGYLKDALFNLAAYAMSKSLVVKASQVPSLRLVK